MAAALCGSWEIFSSENFDEYMVTVGVSEENRKRASQLLSESSKMRQVISKEDDVWSIKVSAGGEQKEIKFKLGEEFDSATIDGRPVKVTVTTDGDKLVENQRGESFQSINTRRATGSEMTMTMCANGVTCTRKYKRI